MAKSVFFTGFPGFLGRELLWRVLERSPDRKAVCIVQERYEADAKKARAEIEAAHPSVKGRIELVRGDIVRPDLGLANAAELAKDVVEVYHLAAVYDLAVGRDLAVKVNVEGTRHVLDFCARCPSLERHHYVSTCYVSGRYTGIFREDDLEKGQAFNNFYEETKHLAEVEVRRRWDQIPTTIYRPAIVVGDSSTGATQKYDGPYFAIRFLLKQKTPFFGVFGKDPLHWAKPSGASPQTPFAIIPVVGDPTAVRLNVVPRDFVVGAITALSGRTDNVGRCYQLADPEPLTVAELTDAMERELGKTLVRIPLPLGLAKQAIAKVPGVQSIFEFPEHVVDYYVHPTHYDTTWSEADLEEHGIRCPRFDSYLGRLFDFVKANPGVSSKAMV